MIHDHLDWFFQWVHKSHCMFLIWAKIRVKMNISFFFKGYQRAVEQKTVSN